MVASSEQDRLAGIDIRRTFDLDGSGFVSAAVLRLAHCRELQSASISGFDSARRSLSAFDPQVFNASRRINRRIG